MNGRIEEDVHEGTVRFFCRSKGHGFIDDDIATAAAEAKVCVVFMQFYTRFHLRLCSYIIFYLSFRITSRMVIIME